MKPKERCVWVINGNHEVISSNIIDALRSATRLYPHLEIIEIKIKKTKR